VSVKSDRGERVMAFNIIITGIGGQGVVSAGTMIAEAALAEGLRIRSSDATGLAQRGGSVHSQIKIGEEVSSSILHTGTADVVLGFEPLEASRWAHMLKRDGVAIVNSNPVYPVTVKNGMLKYPGIEEQKKVFDERGARSIWLDGHALTEKLGNVRVLNSLMIGFTAAKTKIPIGLETLRRVIAEKVPSRTIEVNLKAFDMGYKEGCEEP
jgi:indolepyruvate ferredoxin oxidoreductase beta subunit